MSGVTISLAKSLSTLTSDYHHRARQFGVRGRQARCESWLCHKGKGLGDRCRHFSTVCDRLSLNTMIDDCSAFGKAATCARVGYRPLVLHADTFVIV